MYIHMCFIQLVELIATILQLLHLSILLWTAMVLYSTLIATMSITVGITLLPSLQAETLTN